MGFTLTQKDVERERSRLREEALSKLHPIARFLLPDPRRPTAEEGERLPPRQGPSRFVTKPLTKDAPVIEVSLSTMEAGESDAVVLATRVRPDVHTLGKRMVQGVTALGALVMLSLLLF